jgi:hypothetical protein
MSKTPRYLNHIPETTLLEARLAGATADIGVILTYIEQGAYATDDIQMLMRKIEDLSVAINELRVGIEISAEARCISDEEFTKMVDESEVDDE